MVNYKHNDLVMFVDAVGHVALATFVEWIAPEEEGPARMRIKNPLWVSMVPHQDDKGNVRISLETPAWGFRDLFADHNDDQLWDLVVDKYSFYEGTAFSDILKLHYYNSFARIENGVREQLDPNGKKLPARDDVKEISPEKAPEKAPEQNPQ